MGTSLTRGQLSVAGVFQRVFHGFPSGKESTAASSPMLTNRTANESRGISNPATVKRTQAPFHLCRKGYSRRGHRAELDNLPDIGLFLTFPSGNIGAATHRDFFWAVSSAPCLKGGSRYLRKNHSFASGPRGITLVSVVPGSSHLQTVYVCSVVCLMVPTTYHRGHDT